MLTFNLYAMDINKSGFIGNWDANLTENMGDELYMNIESHMNFNQNGIETFESTVFFLDENKSLISEYNYNTVSHWDVVNKQLIEKIVNCKFDLVDKSKDTQLSSMMEMIISMMCRQGLEVKSDILEISSNKIKMKDGNKVYKFLRVK